MKSFYSSVFIATLVGCGTQNATTSQIQATEERLNVPANHCEIYVEKIKAVSGSHNYGSVEAIVRVPWLGNGEQIEKVGFYGHSEARDLGNARSCNFYPAYKDPEDKIYLGLGLSELSLGQYSFNFPSRSGSVVGSCPGYLYSWIGSFFVQTNYKTYWVNPKMDKSQNFVFDDHLWGNLSRQKGTFVWVNTKGTFLGGYNPLTCER